jgi:hypothetical protein
VPEPPMVALFGMGVLAVFARRRKKKVANAGG